MANHRAEPTVGVQLPSRPPSPSAISIPVKGRAGFSSQSLLSFHNTVLPSLIANSPSDIPTHLHPQAFLPLPAS
ncbi:hypothetical protein Nepgr_030839 [Nepenthes gracilis]|uniref:Uncharacterized protein n=1 Tax=Nepenthes gracilis TaxID=150966 RepID=A0AAD3Y6Z3_NEPGR|nr:hypothetical protein Nepgr_030839 [Nepenthes gracilis]